MANAHDLLMAQRAAMMGGEWTPNDNAWWGHTGTQWFDLGLPATLGLKVEIDYYNETDASTNPVGLYDNTTGTANRFMIQTFNAENVINAYFGSSLTAPSWKVRSKGLWNVVSVEKGSAYLNGIRGIVGTSMNQPLHNPCVGCYHVVRPESEEFSNAAVGRFRYVKAWVDGVMARDWRPRFNGTKWIPYDLITKSYAVNLGTGDFTGGVD